MRVRNIGLALLAAFALTGCYEEGTSVIMFEPGVYKGSPDQPLTAEDQEALRERMSTGQGRQ